VHALTRVLRWVADPDWLVQFVGSRSSYLEAVPVSRGIPAAEMLPGRDCVLAVFEPTDPTDLMLVAVH
jgi:hypothetical protein